MLVPHFFEEVTHWYGFAGVDIESAKFGFRSTRHDGFDDLGDVEDGAVIRGIINICGTEEMPTNTAAGEGFAEVGCVAMDGENHLAPLVGENCIRVVGGVIKDPSDEVDGVLGGS